MHNKQFFTLTMLFIFACFSNSLFSQGTIKGVITGEDEPEGLVGATVVIGSTGTTTEYDGSFEMSLPAGEHTIQISYTGYDTFRETFTLGNGETKEITQTLPLTTNILQTATVTSGKFEKPLGEVTVSLEVIKPGLAEATNSINVDEVLEKVPGVTIVDGQANIRGGSGFSYGAGSRVLLLVDDIPILAGDAGFPNWSDVPVENIEQIEVVKGAASALYGSSALNGIINIRTAYAKNEPETNFSMFSEIFSAPKDDAKHWWKPDNVPTPMKVGASFVHRQKFNKIDWVFGSTGYIDYRYIQNAQDKKLRFTNKLRYRVNENLNLGAYVNFNTGNSNTVFLWEDGESGAYVGDTGNMTNSTTTRFNIDPFVTYLDDNGNRHKYMGRYFKVSNDNANDQGNFSDLFYNEYQYQKRLDDIDLTLTGGIVSTNTIVNGTLYGDTTFYANNFAVYLQSDKKFYLSKNPDGSNNTKRNALNISAGFRYEYNSLTGPTVVNGEYVGEAKDTDARPVFRLGLNYQAAEYTYIRASWGQGYRFPTIAEKYITTQVGGVNILPNTDLEPETGWSAEFGIKQGVEIGGFQGFVDVSGFWSEYQDMMEFNFTEDPTSVVNFGFSSQNVGDTEIKGAEITLAGGSKKDARFPTTVLIGYTFINPQFKEFEEFPVGTTFTDIPNLTEGQINNFFSTSSENILKYRNRHTFKFDVETTFKKVALGVSLNGGSKVEAIDTAFGIFPGVSQYREDNDVGYWVLGTRLGFSVTEEVKLSFVAKNVTNREYSVRPGQLEAPRSFSLRIDCKF